MDGRDSYWHITRSMDALVRSGLARHALGFRCHVTGVGEQSVAEATGDLVNLIGHLVDVGEPRELLTGEELVVLRDVSRHAIDYKDTAETVRIRFELERINQATKQLDVRHLGKSTTMPSLRRIFNCSFDRGGRLYYRGSSVQGMSKRARLDLEIDGSVVVEIDYSSLHLALAYSECGARLPSGDLYEIAGYDRRAVKVGSLIALNAKDSESARWAIAKALQEDADLRPRSDRANLSSREGAYLPFAEGLLCAIKSKHYAIRHLFHSDAGARFQKLDSNIAVEVALDVLDRTGRVPLMLHDSFLVPEKDADVLQKSMLDAASQRGLEVRIQIHRAVQTTIEDLLESEHPLVPKAQGPSDPERELTRIPSDSYREITSGWDPPPAPISVGGTQQLSWTDSVSSPDGEAVPDGMRIRLTEDWGSKGGLCPPYFPGQTNEARSRSPV
ncbi:hypothetical protein [Rhodococcus sp. IEGM 1302]|uniref:hypothetical protein n=1 Tax=Rhodococcus sp. IEGM 1302 TaxID=3047093 RepID=UPI0024B82463|nr:hypothetical protein [Rhodococcus sp. IEGM 1302]MDI9947018.1 hypothetical protein [Rhodococcus sp. IEGM 1302]